MLQQIQTLSACVEGIEYLDEHEEGKEGGEEFGLRRIGTDFVTAGEQFLGEATRQKHDAQKSDNAAVDQNGRPHIRVDQLLVTAHRFLQHVARQSGFSGEGQSGQGVHDDVQPQQLGHGQRQVKAEELAQEHHQNGGYIDRQLENQELADGFEQGTNVIVLAATNRADVLDSALQRPGRFDRKVNISLPDRKDREAILKIHFEKKPLAKNVDLDALAAKSAGSSGADLANIANEAAIVAARHNRKEIHQDDVTSAFEKVAIGPERKGKIMSEKEKELTAYHEAGHAIVGHVLPESDMVHKVTIIPRGGTGGVTWFLPPEDRSYHSISEYKDILGRMLGGRIAEEVVFGRDNVTNGAGDDLRKAAELARDMVINQGMGKKLKDQVFHVDEGMMMERMVHEKQYSDETAKIIDDEVENLITEAAHRAREVIKANRTKLNELKDRLIQKETVEADEVLEVLKGSVLPKSVV